MTLPIALVSTLLYFVSRIENAKKNNALYTTLASSGPDGRSVAAYLDHEDNEKKLKRNNAKGGFSKEAHNANKENTEKNIKHDDDGTNGFSRHSQKALERRTAKLSAEETDSKTVDVKSGFAKFKRVAVH